MPTIFSLTTTYSYIIEILYIVEVSLGKLKEYFGTFKSTCTSLTLSFGEFKEIFYDL